MANISLTLMRMAMLWWGTLHGNAAAHLALWRISPQARKWLRDQSCSVAPDNVERGINLANEGGNEKNYIDSRIDAVPNIIGLNGNPVRMLGSFVALPFLFAGPERSPHTLPPAKPTTPWSKGVSVDMFSELSR